MPLLILNGDITNCHRIDGASVDALVQECHTIRLVAGHEGQSVWECERATASGVESTFHLVVTTQTFSHEALSHYERRLRDAYRLRAEAIEVVCEVSV